MSVDGVVTVTDVKFDDNEFGIVHSQRFEVVFETVDRTMSRLSISGSSQLDSTDFELSSVADSNLSMKRSTEDHGYRPLADSGMNCFFSCASADCLCKFIETETVTRGIN